MMVGYLVALKVVHWVWKLVGMMVVMKADLKVDLKVGLMAV